MNVTNDLTYITWRFINEKLFYYKLLMTRIKCRIPGTRATYSPVNFIREHISQINFLHFSNSLVSMLAKSLVNLLAEVLVKMLVEALVNMLVEALVNMLAEALVNILAKSLVDIMAEALVNMLIKSLEIMLAQSLVNMLAKLLLNLLPESLVNIYAVWVTDEKIELVISEEVGLIFAFFHVYKFQKYMKINL